jgi:hypothetical protein
MAHNVIIGHTAAYSMTTGNWNTMIGRQVATLSTTINNSILLGSNNLIQYTSSISDILSFSVGGAVSVSYPIFGTDITTASPSIRIGGNNALGLNVLPSVTASAILDLYSTTKGFLPPRMTTTQINAIASPAAGLQVYDATLNLPSFYNGTAWVNYGVNIYNSNGSLTGDRTMTIGDYSLSLSKTQTGLTGANDFVGTSIVSAPTTNASISWTASKGFFNYQGIFSPTFGGNITFQNSNYAGQELKINRISFASAGSTVTMTQSTGIRAFSNAILHNYIDGANSGTISHFASLALYGDFASNSARFTFTNRYGLLINDFQEYGQGHTYINRWAIYQAGVNDLNYFSSKLLVGSTTDIASAKVIIDSTSQGVLVPRMTTTQINAITSPADGLLVYNTTISHMCCYLGGVWHKFNSSNM